MFLRKYKEPLIVDRARRPTDDAPVLIKRMKLELQRYSLGHNSAEFQTSNYKRCESRDGEPLPMNKMSKLSMRSASRNSQEFAPEGTAVTLALHAAGSGRPSVLDQDVRLEVALVLGAVRAVRALQPGRLAALHLEVLPQVALPAIHVAALWAGELAGGVAGLSEQQLPVRGGECYLALQPKERRVGVATLTPARR